MTTRWRYEIEARAEVLSATRYYNAQRRDLGREFYQAVKDALVRIAEVPERATKHPLAPEELGLLRHQMHRFPYGIVFYRTSADENRIVAVSHVRREPLYWLERVPRR